MKVAVIGSSGGMGSFFVKYFLSVGDEVSGSDPKRATTTPRNLSFFSSNKDAVKDSDLTLIASPAESTVEVAREVRGSLKEGSTLAEISSVKETTVPKLLKVLGERVALLSLHPLFGPSLANSKGMKIAVAILKDPALEMRLARNAFPNANLFPVDFNDHDRLMGLVLSLTHIVNLAYASTLSKHMKAEQFRKLSTPTSLVQLTLAEGILSQNPPLYSYIQTENRHSKEVIDALTRELRELRRMVGSRNRKDFEKTFSNLADFYLEDATTNKSLEKVYLASRTIEDG